MGAQESSRRVTVENAEDDDSIGIVKVLLNKAKWPIAWQSLRATVTIVEILVFSIDIKFYLKLSSVWNLQIIQTKFWSYLFKQCGAIRQIDNVFQFSLYSTIETAMKFMTFSLTEICNLLLVISLLWCMFLLS